jgi:hypothetical protein
MYRIFGIAALVTAIGLGWSSQARAQTTVTIPITMTLSAAASAVAGASLAFGTIIANPSGGTVILDPIAGGITGIGALGSPAGTRGTINVTRTGSVIASAAAPATTVSLVCGSTTLAVTVTVDNSACTPAGTTACIIGVGGTFTLPANAAASTCTPGSASITVSYF